MRIGNMSFWRNESRRMLVHFMATGSDQPRFQLGDEDRRLRIRDRDRGSRPRASGTDDPRRARARCIRARRRPVDPDRTISPAAIAAAVVVAAPGPAVLSTRNCTPEARRYPSYIVR